jgi:hypothetical protein
LLKDIAAEEFVVVRVHGGNGTAFKRPRAAVMNDIQLRPNGYAVGAKINQPVFVVFTSGQLNRQTGADKGFNIHLGAKCRVCFAGQWWAP